MNQPIDKPRLIAGGKRRQQTGTSAKPPTITETDIKTDTHTHKSKQPIACDVCPVP